MPDYDAEFLPGRQGRAIAMTEAEPSAQRKSRRRRSRILIVALVVLLLCLGGAALAIVLSNGRDSTDSTVDTSHRANPQSLGSAPDGPTWTAVLGTWGIADNAA